MLPVPLPRRLQIYKFGLKLPGVESTLWERIPHCSQELMWNRHACLNIGKDQLSGFMLGLLAADTMSVIILTAF